VDRRGEEFDEAARGMFGHRRAGTASELRSADALAGKGMPVKTDRKDARSIAQLMRLGWFRPVHCKSLPAQEVRALLTARKLLQTKNHDVEISLRRERSWAASASWSPAMARCQRWLSRACSTQHASRAMADK
jgi:transposase